MTQWENCVTTGLLESMCKFPSSPLPVTWTDSCLTSPRPIKLTCHRTEHQSTWGRHRVWARSNVLWFTVHWAALIWVGMWKGIFKENWVKSDLCKPSVLWWEDLFKTEFNSYGQSLTRSSLQIETMFWAISIYRNTSPQIKLLRSGINS